MVCSTSRMELTTASRTWRGQAPSVPTLKYAWPAGMENWLRIQLQKCGSSAAGQVSAGDAEDTAGRNPIAPRRRMKSRRCMVPLMFRQGEIDCNRREDERRGQGRDRSEEHTSE